jgi:hypothetical protein
VGWGAEASAGSAAGDAAAKQVQEGGARILCSSAGDEPRANERQPRRLSLNSFVCQAGGSRPSCPATAPQHKPAIQQRNGTRHQQRQQAGLTIPLAQSVGEGIVVAVDAALVGAVGAGVSRAGGLQAGQGGVSFPLQSRVFQTADTDNATGQLGAHARRSRRRDTLSPASMSHPTVADSASASITGTDHSQSVPL